MADRYVHTVATIWFLSLFPRMLSREYAKEAHGILDQCCGTDRFGSNMSRGSPSRIVGTDTRL